MNDHIKSRHRGTIPHNKSLWVITRAVRVFRQFCIQEPQMPQKLHSHSIHRKLMTQRDSHRHNADPHCKILSYIKYGKLLKARITRLWRLVLSFCVRAMIMLINLKCYALRGFFTTLNFSSINNIKLVIISKANTKNEEVWHGKGGGV